MEFLTRLKQKPMLFDGGIGSMLIDRGLPTGVAPDAWNLERPDEVRRIHELYYEAGADVVQSNSFGGTELKLTKSGLGDRAGDINRAAAELVLSVRPSGRYASGDMGPTGLLLAPLGELDPGQAEENFARQAVSLAAGGMDLLSVETVYQLGEAVAAMKGIRRVTTLPVFVSITFQSTPRGFFTLMGDSPEQAASTLEELGVDLIGANCTLTSEEILPLAKQLRRATSLPLCIQPNAGQPELDPETCRPVYRADPEIFARHLLQLVDAGIDAVGGCCGSTPEYIAETRRLLNHREGQNR